MRVKPSSILFPINCSGMGKRFSVEHSAMGNVSYNYYVFLFYIWKITIIFRYRWYRNMNTGKITINLL